MLDSGFIATTAARMMLAVSLVLFVTSVQLAARAESAKIPVIFDSDIGDDIDDTWALALLLKSPELDVKLVVGDQGKTEYRAKLFAKFLQSASRTDIPIGMGLDVNAEGVGRQAAWVADYDLSNYPGTIIDDGVQAIIDTIMNSPQRVTVIAVGPLPNIKAALEREPRIAEKATFVGMHGSVRRGYGDKSKPDSEYNVKADVKACQATLSAAWDITITPLDTCGVVNLQGDKYAKVFACQDPLVRALIANYKIWSDDKQRASARSSTLFDTVAVYLTFRQELCQMEMLPIRVTDDGMTVIDSAAKKMRVATAWQDVEAFEDFLVARLTGSPSTAGDWRRLFDGTTLRGWHPVGAGKWTVEDGAIVGRSLREPLYGLLFSDDQYDDFTVRLKFKVLSGDSGFYIRTIFKEPDQAHGNQVQVGLAGSGVGGVYESYGRGWLDKPGDAIQQQVLKDGDWNDMMISAKAGDIRVHVNGERTADIKHDASRRQGHFALQMHAKDLMHVMFKDIEILAAR